MPSTAPSTKPSTKPSLSPSESAEPSLSPSDVPSSSSQPSESVQPSEEPSLSPSESTEPSLSPSVSGVPSTSAAPSCLLPSIAVVTNNTQVPIPGVNDGPSLVTLTVANESDECVIEDVDIVVGIDHSWVGDLELTLSSPGGTGTTAILIDNQGGSPDLVSTNPITFDDASLQDPSTIIANQVSGIVQAGTFFSQGDGAGNNKLSSFAGGSPLGDWTFTVVDTFPALDDGTIRNVTLRVTSICPCELEPSLSPSISLNPTTSTSVSCLTLNMSCAQCIFSFHIILNLPFPFFLQPSLVPSESSSPSTSLQPSNQPSLQPSDVPSVSNRPSVQPSISALPSSSPSTSLVPSSVPSIEPSVSMIPSLAPSISTQPSSSSQPSTCVVEITSPVATLIGNSGSGRQLNFAFPNLEAAVGDVQVEVNTRGDLGVSIEFYTITAEGGSVSLETLAIPVVLHLSAM